MQYFLNAKSTQTNLMEYMEKLTKLVDEGLIVNVAVTSPKALMLSLRRDSLESVGDWGLGAKFADDSKTGMIVESPEYKQAFQVRLETWCQD